MFDKYYITIGEKCSVNVIKDLAKKLEVLLKNETHGTLYSFYDRKGYRSDEPAELLSCGLRSIMLAKAQKDPESLEPILETFLEDDYLIFTKIVLYVMAENMNKFRNLFFKIINTDVGIKIFEDTPYWGDELKHVLDITQYGDKQYVVEVIGIRVILVDKDTLGVILKRERYGSTNYTGSCG